MKSVSSTFQGSIVRRPMVDVATLADVDTDAAAAAAASCRGTCACKYTRSPPPGIEPALDLGRRAVSRGKWLMSESGVFV